METLLVHSSLAIFLLELKDEAEDIEKEFS